MSESIYEALRNLSEREHQAKPENIHHSKKLHNTIFYLYISCIILSIVMAFLWKLTQIEYIKTYSIIFLYSAYAGHIVYHMLFIFYYRNNFKKLLKNPLSFRYEHAKQNHKIDYLCLQSFMSSERQKLEFVCLELIAEKNALKKRTSLVVGSIDKIGLIPGLLALFLSIDKMGSMEIDWLLTIAYIIPVLYGAGAYFHILITRMSRHISILEYAINEKKTNNCDVRS